MTRDELIRRLRRLARGRGVDFDVESARGKGGHWMVQYGAVRQAVPQVKGRDLPVGTFHGILRGYGLTPRDLE